MIQVEKLTKRYGDLLALDNLELHIGAGEIFGLIGPNGAGKTTTLKILATLLKPSSGSVRVAGHDLRTAAAKIRHAIGYVPDFAGVYEDMQLDEYLAFFAAAADITGKQATSMIGDVLELTDLTDKKEALVESLSRGMCQRLSIARVLLHDPQVLILDEPASGLSPRGRVEMRMLLKELCSMHKTIIISSHILPELEALCSTVGVLEQGQMRYKGSVEELMAACRKGNIVHVRVIPDDYDSRVSEIAQEVAATLGESTSAPSEEIAGKSSAQSTVGNTETTNREGTRENSSEESVGESSEREDDCERNIAEVTRRARDLLNADPRIGATVLQENTIEVTLAENQSDPSFIPELLLRGNFPLYHFSEEPLTLEDAFMRLTTSGV